MNYLHVTFGFLQKEHLEILVAQLTDIGFEGFEEKGEQLHAFIPEKDLDEKKFNELMIDHSLTFNIAVVQPTNWNAEWEKNFEPVVVNDFCAVRAHFHPPVTGVRYEIVITPKMSFGTGHHATTWMMIDYMQELELAGKKVLDFGTGTGILAILAEKCGSTGIAAIDNDDWSIENAAENIAINQCTAITLEKADTLQMTAQFDVVLANINKNVLLGNMAALQQHLKPGGVVIMSGLLTGDRQEIEAAAIRNSLEPASHKERQNWIALELKPEV